MLQTIASLILSLFKAINRMKNCGFVDDACVCILQVRLILSNSGLEKMKQRVVGGLGDALLHRDARKAGAVDTRGDDPVF